jgi:hypothetical protein
MKIPYQNYKTAQMIRGLTVSTVPEVIITSFPDEVTEESPRNFA